MTARVLIIGLDGADGTMVDRLSADGSLPHLAALRARGGGQKLTSPLGSSDDALWASFQYGVDVGEHGRYHYFARRRDGRIGFAHEEEDRPRFWDELSAAGARIAIIDMPKSPKPRPINGLHLADWLTHGEYFKEPVSEPPALAGEVMARFGQMRHHKCSIFQDVLDDAGFEATIDNLGTALAQKRAAGLHYLQSEAWDLFFIGIKDAHCCNHRFWDFHPDHPACDPARAARLGNPMLMILQRIDAAIGDLIAAAGSDAEIIVFSTTDFEPNGSLRHLMRPVVNRLNARIWARRYGPIGWLLGRFGLAVGRVPQWPCRLLPYNENSAAFRIAGSDRLRDAIEREILDLRDCATGGGVVTSVRRPSAEFVGAASANLPDLLIRFHNGLVPTAVWSPSIGQVAVPVARIRPGNHADGGFIIAAGPQSTSAQAGIKTLSEVGAFVKTRLGTQREATR